jgi:hypothetical protein
MMPETAPKMKSRMFLLILPTGRTIRPPEPVANPATRLRTNP